MTFYSGDVSRPDYWNLQRLKQGGILSKKEDENAKLKLGIQSLWTPGRPCRLVSAIKRRL